MVCSGVRRRGILRAGPGGSQGLGSSSGNLIRSMSAVAAHRSGPQYRPTVAVWHRTNLQEKTYEPL
jgi:hypothetical protein